MREKGLVMEFKEKGLACAKTLWYETAYWVQEIGNSLEWLERKGVWSRFGTRYG